MPIDIRQLNIRSSIADRPSVAEDVSGTIEATIEALAQTQKQEIITELKIWIEQQLRRQQGR